MIIWNPLFNVSVLFVEGWYNFQSQNIVNCSSTVYFLILWLSCHIEIYIKIAKVHFRYIIFWYVVIETIYIELIFIK